MTVANTVTLARLPLLGLLFFLLARGQVAWAMGAFAVAWALDGIDGWLARRLHQETQLGYWLDKIIDRLILVGGGIALLAQGFLPPLALLLFTKDIIAVTTLYIQSRAREAEVSLGWPGKVMTLLQGGAMLWLVLSGQYAIIIIGVVALLGAVVGGHALYRAVYR